ncbi:carboxypeptidase regulatory-like domain-containing protein [Clostridium tarantellae]|uniref:CBM6 domain-containing protein n=1 Tax=Clostridium tarantellae TaxID=39493 RepID=A0A6I1MLE5_9CLOT|nr:carboxypeptidase regulatory-like domain-containing protein [Clostridium tarantellae]MPQ43814.1 hypothetical protein [Clostridium tarantellae]
MQIRRDKYNLTKSHTIEITEKDIDVKADINLYSNANEINIGASISGTVVDTLNIPIKNAIVKLIDSNLEPLTYVRTDTNGNYVINFIPPSSVYKILSTATGKILNHSNSFSLQNGENKIINFTLSNDPNTLFGAINGILTNNEYAIIKGAVIYLYRINNSLEELSAITYSDYEGTFIFSELLPGNYKIKITSLSYINSEEIITVESKKIVSFKKILSFKTFVSNGSVSGVITDKLNNSIGNADVILYKIDEKDVQTPVAFTKTNFSGIYSFVNVPFGSYFIKSNATQNLDINNLITPSVKITSTREIDTYNISTGLLENGAQVDYLTGFVTSLGGVNDGGVTLSINVEKAGLYTLDIQYTSADFNRPLKLEVNDKGNGEIYKVPITSGWEPFHTKTIYILTTLNEGVNIIKFHGDGVNLAPNLNMVTLILNQTESVTLFDASSDQTKSKTYNVALGKFVGDVKVNTITNFAEGIGGPKDNSSTITVDVADTAIYYLVVKYLAAFKNLNFKLQVNNEYNEDIYTVMQTKTMKISDALTFTLPIALNAKSNTIEFHGDGKTYAPYFGEFTLSLPPVTSNLIEGILENGAKVDTKKTFVTALGGKKNGSSTVTVNVINSGKYNLSIKYVGTSNNLPLKIDVNGVNNNTIYTFPKTKGLTLNDIKTFTIPLSLYIGNNTLKFYGNGKDTAPNLSSFILTATDTSPAPKPTIPTTIANDIYFITNAITGGTAMLDKNQNLITDVGGKGNSFFTMDVSVKVEGEYVLRIAYRNNNRNFKIDVNEKDTGKIYKTIGDFNDLFSTLINLNSGKNTLKFYGNGTELAPDFGNLRVDLNYPINSRLADGLLSENAKILPSGAINSLGGFDENFFAINYFTDEYGEYLLNLILSSQGGNLLIDINGVNTETIYNIPTSKTTTIAYSTKITLEEGDNSIKFYGNDENFVPDIYSIDLKKNFMISPKQIYDFYTGTLTNSAKLNVYNNFIEGIGTNLKGTVSLTVEVDSDNFYDLNIEYLAYFEENILYLTVNKEAISSPYYLPMTAGRANSKAEIFTIERISLKKGTNTLEFSGDNITPAPMVGTLKITQSPPFSYSPDTFFVKNGVLKDGAKISDISKNFVMGLGGLKDGSSTIEIENESEGLYYLIIEYLTGDNKNILAVTINNDTTFYNLPITEKLEESYAKTFLIPIVMKPGTDIIKFHGNGINSTPMLGKLNFTLAPDFTTYNVSHGSLENGATIDTTTGFTTKLGGIFNGSSTVNVVTDDDGDYYLTIKYISTATDRPLKLDINGVNTGTIYKLPKTSVGTLPNPKTFTIKIPLVEGFNFIKFYGIEAPLAPDLESFVITNNELIKTYDITEAILSKGAKKFKIPGFICCLGGLRNGSATLKVNVDKEGLYDLAFKYLSGNTSRPLKLKVNNISMKNIYKLPPTVDFEIKNAKTFTIPIKLKSGENEIKFSGNYSFTDGPNIGQVTLSLNMDKPLIIYKMADGKLNGSATIDKDLNVVNNLGGKGKGEVTLTVNVVSAGLYDLNIQYVSKTKSYLLVDINDNFLRTPYSFLPTFIDNIPMFDTFTIEANLIAGNNTIKFYCSENCITPMLRTLTVTPNTSTSKNLPPGTYNVAAGKLENGAIVDANSNFVTNLGGKRNGSSTVTVKVTKTGVYKVSVEYFSNNPLNSFCIAINNKDTGNIYNTNNTKLYSNITYFEVELKKGENTIKFYGDGTNPSPDFQIFTLTQ